MLKRFMEKKHYRPLSWNDSSSTLLYNLWLKELDGEKIYFTKKEIASLDQFRTRSSVVSPSQKDFFTASVDLYRQRLHEADSSTNAYLSKPIDFVKPDNFYWPATDYAADNKELELRRKHYLKWSVLDDIADQILADKKTPTPAIPADFAASEAEVRQRIRKKQTASYARLMQSPTDFREDMQDEFLDAIARTYDPHSNYMNLRLKQQFEAAVSAEDFTAGFTLETNDKGERLIDELQPGGSAWKSGQVHKGDLLVKVKSGKKEYDAEDMDDAELSSVLGNSGTIDITIKTAAGEIKTVKLAQETEQDEESTVKSYLLKGDKTFGYIDLPGFYSKETDSKKLSYEGCAKDMSRELIKLKKDNIDGLIIDLRNNGGGSMWEAIQLAGLFIDAGPVASVKDRDGKLQFMKDPNRGTMYDGPMVILTNGRSASASEFFAATMQDYHRALIVGGTTYGKGTAQVVVPLDTINNSTIKDYHDFVKVTGSKFYRVIGSTVQWKGVEPDIALPDIYAVTGYNERSNSTALIPDTAKAGYYQPLPDLPLALLQQKSAARIAGDPYFLLLNKFLQMATDVQKGMNIPLDWTGFVNFHQKLYPVVPGGETEPETKKPVLQTENNSFDKERFSHNTGEATEMNASFLERLSHSRELAEATKILSDRINIK
ncbi:MAG: S41 family peptidase [Ferruginibacter sp.]